ncbi:glycoside hydrolase family 97 protein [Neptunicella sp. SCSIO 80796]|uniref:glycoside hydrolase family 97 protein n=1 Tax=Neptunicella plasticusilytica TaxID=3117012 RepID=UPI003A4DF8E1
MLKPIVLLALLLSLIACQHQAKPGEDNMFFTVNSPSGTGQLRVSINSRHQPVYQYFYRGKEVVATSRLGFNLKDLPALDGDFIVVDSQQSEHNDTWEQPWGEEHYIKDNYHQLRLSLQQQDGQQRKLNLVFRLFDQGLGFRYEFPAQDGLQQFEITRELTEFNVDKELSSWWTPAQAGNQYEYLYRNSPVKDIKLIHTPVTFISADSYALSIHEAALHDYSTMNLQNNDGVLSAALVPWSPQTDVKVKVSAPFKTPWRTISVADDETGLMTNYITLNLNEPNKLGDVSWVKPGKYVGIWWELHLELGSWKQGDKHGATTENTKKYIDFAAQHHFDAVLVEGWNQGWDGEWWNHGGGAFSFTQPYPDYDLAEVNRYAAEKGVYIVGHHETGADVVNYENQLQAAYQLLDKYNMKAVKSGYVETGEVLTSGEYHQGQYFVRHAERAVQMAARHHVMLDAHETIKDTGERRTYPNLMSREVARGQEYNAWSEDGGNPPNHTTILPFTRMLAGPMDFTPGIFDVELPTRPNNRVNTTLVKQLALYVVLYSPLQMAADLPQNYQKHLDALRFIEDVPVDWETTKVLAGKIGQYVSIARQQRDSENWFVGAITNENARQLEVDFGFLDPDKLYQARIYRDADNSHYLQNPTHYQIEETDISAKEKRTFQLAAGGGLAISLIAK